MVETAGLSRVRRRPRPLKELDQAARAARLRLEREIYRPRLVRATSPVHAGSTRADRAGAAHSRRPRGSIENVLIRALIDEALAWRSTMRPKWSGPARGKQPYPIEI